MATYESAIVASLFAATYPERTRSLILVDRDRFPEVPPETGHFVASKIPGARVVEQSSGGGSHFHWYARGDAIVAEVRRFLAEIGEEEASFDRILATVLFTDIVNSTKRAVELGDRRWSEVVVRHHTVVRTLLARYRGIEIGARVAALAAPSEVFVSQTVRDLIAGSDLTFADRGSHELKGVPGVWSLYAARKDGPPGASASITAPA